MRKRTFYLVSGFVLAAIISPYVIAALAGRDHFVFGGFLLNPVDGNSYLAKMMLGAQGEWEFRLPYTSSAEPSAYLFLFYIFLGHISRILHVQPIIIFHTTRVLGAIFLLFSLKLFYTQIFRKNNKQAELAFILSALGSGLGWCAAIFGGFTTDMWVAEAYPFLSMYINPHFPIGLGLVLLFFSKLMDSSTINIKDWWMVFVGLATSIIMPFQMVIVGIVGGIFSVVEWVKFHNKQLLKLILFFSLGGPYLLYQYWASKVDPYLSAWDRQNITPSPAIWDFAVSFLPLIIFSIAGTVSYFKIHTNDDRRLFLIIWLIVGIALTYAPFSLQRRLMTGYFIPVVGLAVAAIYQIRLVKLRKSVIIFMIVLVPLTNGLIVSTGVLGAKSNARALYLSKDEVMALDWIGAQTQPTDIVLSSPEMGLFIPAYTGRRVVYGHPFETMNAYQVENAVLNFFHDPNDRENILWLSEKGIDYVFMGERELNIGGAGDFTEAPVYENLSVKIYRVKGAQ